MQKKNKYRIGKYLLLSVVIFYAVFLISLFFRYLPVYIQYKLNSNSKSFLNQVQACDNSLLFLDSNSKTIVEYYSDKDNFKIKDNSISLTEDNTILSFKKQNNIIYVLKQQLFYKTSKKKIYCEIYNNQKLIKTHYLKSIPDFNKIDILFADEKELYLIYNSKENASIIKYNISSNNIKTVNKINEIYYSIDNSNTNTIITFKTKGIYSYNKDLEQIIDGKKLTGKNITPFRSGAIGTSIYIYDSVTRTVFTYDSLSRNITTLFKVPKSSLYDFKNIVFWNNKPVIFNHALSSISLYDPIIKQTELLFPISSFSIYTNKAIMFFIVLTFSLMLFILTIRLFRKKLFHYSLPIFIKQILLFSPLFYISFLSFLCIYIFMFENIREDTVVSDMKILSNIILNNINSNNYSELKDKTCSKYLETIKESYNYKRALEIFLYKDTGNNQFFLSGSSDVFPKNTLITPHIYFSKKTNVSFENNKLKYFTKFNFDENCNGILLLQTSTASIVHNYYRVYIFAIIVFISYIILFLTFLALYNYILSDFIRNLSNLFQNNNNEKYEIIELARNEIGMISDSTIKFNKLFNEYKQTFRESIEDKNKKIEKLNSEIKRELTTARTIQKTIIPSEFDKLSGLEAASKYIPMNSLGGDFFDIIKLGPKKYAAVIADVSGHGIGASLVTAMAKMLFTSASKRYKTSGQVANYVNQRMLNSIGETGIYMTAFFSVIDLENNILEYTNAGHFDIYLLKKINRYVIPLPSCSSIIGMFRNEIYSTRKIKIENGDKLFLYTDGIIEAKNSLGEQFRKERLLKILNNNLNQNPKTIINNVIDEVNHFCQNHEADDDKAMLCIEICNEEDA